MLVSFIIIAYNAEKFLDKSLESLKNMISHGNAMSITKKNSQPPIQQLQTHLT